LKQIKADQEELNEFFKDYADQTEQKDESIDE